MKYTKDTVGRGINLLFRDKSNCHIHAWERLRNDEADFLCIEFTKKSKLVAWMEKHPKVIPWMLPIRFTGAVVQWIVWPLVHFGELLRTGRWFHFSWVKSKEHFEFVPETNLPPEDRPPKWIPKLVFKGMINNRGKCIK